MAALHTGRGNYLWVVLCAELCTVHSGEACVETCGGFAVGRSVGVRSGEMLGVVQRVGVLGVVCPVGVFMGKVWEAVL